MRGRPQLNTGFLERPRMWRRKIFFGRCRNNGRNKIGILGNIILEGCQVKMTYRAIGNSFMNVHGLFAANNVMFALKDMGKLNGRGEHEYR